MMYPLLFPAFVTGSIYLAHSLVKSEKKPKPIYYLALFLGLVLLELIFSTAKAEATEYNLKSHLLLQSEQQKKETKKKLSEKEIHEDYLKVCKEQLEYHREQALKCYEEAEKICTVFPSIDDREKAQWCLKSAFAAALPTTPTYRIMAAAILLCEQYCSEMVENWQRLDTKLHQAKSHAEMYEHYRQLEIYTTRQLKLIKSQDNTIIINP